MKPTVTLKVIIAGCRDRLVPLVRIKETLDMFFPDLPIDKIEIVSGGATGVDSCAKKYALGIGHPFKEFTADWTKLGRSAGPKRNREMAQYAHVLLAFWDGESGGTKNMIDQMKRLRKRAHVIDIRDCPKMKKAPSSEG